MQQDQVAFLDSPVRAQCWVAQSRVKAIAINATTQQGQILYAGTQKLALLAGTGGQGHARVVVEPAQVRHDRSLQQAQAIMLGILLKVGMEATDHRNLQPICDAQGGPAKRSFGGQVHRMGAFCLPQTLQR